jgi:serine/threonine protein kinase
MLVSHHALTPCSDLTLNGWIRKWRCHVFCGEAGVFDASVMIPPRLILWGLSLVSCSITLPLLLLPPPSRVGTMGVLPDLVVPGSGTVAQALASISQQCAEMKEAESTVKRIHQRLEGLSTELTKLEKKKRVVPPDALNKYVAAVSSTLLYMERYRGKKLVFRLMKHQGMNDELRRINEEIDEILRVLGFVKAKSFGAWKQPFEDDLRVQHELLAASVDNAQGVLAELQDARSQQETMLTLKYEVEHRPEQKSPEMAKFLKTMVGTVIRASMTAVPKLPPWFLPPYEIHFDPEPFSRGSFATLHRGVWRSNANVVVKCFLVEGVDIDDRTRQSIEEEMNIWHGLNHPNIVKLLGASHISTPPFIVCEDATNGDLCSFLAASDANKAQTWRLLYQAALGLDYTHRKSVVHGDLKLNNILVGADGLAKLSDFGLSAVRTSTILSETTGESPFTAGALRWRAPECMKKAPTFASDVYSFAMCIIEAVVGEPPFALLDDDSVHEKLRNGEIPDRPDQVSPEVWELVVAMTNADPDKRIGVPDVLEKLKAFAGEGASNSPRRPTKPVQAFATDATSADYETAESLPSADVAVNTHDKEQAQLQLDQSCADDEGRPVTPEPLLNADVIVDILDMLPALEDLAKEQALLELLRLCVGEEDRLVLYEANGVQILSNLVRSGATYYTKLYALQCLKWAALLDSKLSAPEFEGLRGSVQDAPVKELASVVSALRDGTDSEKEVAAIRCACIATRGNGSFLRDVAVLQPLVALWQSVNDVQKLWAMEAMAGVDMENETIRAEIVRVKAATPLVALLQLGSDEQKHKAIYALKSLALQKEVGQAIVRLGAIAALIKIVRLGTNQHRQTTTELIASLVLPSYPSSADVARETACAPLVALALVGTDEQKETAVTALLNLAKVEEAQAEIARTGGITVLVELLSSGTNLLKARAAGALVNLAASAAIREEISREGGIAPLVELLWKGNSQQKFYAVGVLANLSFSGVIAAEIALEKGVAPLIDVVRTGTEEQKDCAIAALRRLASHDNIRAEIASEGGLEPLIELVQSGTDERKASAIDVLIQLSYDEAVRSSIVEKGGVPPLVELLRAGTDQHKEKATELLKNLAQSEAGRTEIAREGGVSHVVELLRSGTEQQRCLAAETMESLARSNDKMRAELVREGSIPLLKALGKSGSSLEKESADRALRQLNGGCCLLM